MSIGFFQSLKELRKIAEDYEQLMYADFREVMIKIDDDLQNQTPKVSGNLRANWIPSVRRNVLTPIFDQSVKAPPNSRSRPANLNPRTVWPVKGTIRRRLFLTNNVVYLPRINALYGNFIERILARRIEEGGRG